MNAAQAAKTIASAVIILSGTVATLLGYLVTRHVRWRTKNSAGCCGECGRPDRLMHTFPCYRHDADSCPHRLEDV